MREPKQLVLCFDGTNNQFGTENTNVVKLFGMLTKNDTSKQKVYYQTGIGTYDLDGVTTKLGLAVDSAVATSIKDHIIGGYKFLMQTYESGDEISLFGFSRGAVTARALAAMLYIVGLLPEDNDEHVPFAWAIFEQAHEEIERSQDDPRRFESLNFKRTFSRDVLVNFLGLWDTVIGVAPVRLYRNTNYNPIVHYVRHAMALDETRDRFQVEPWGEPPALDSDEAFRENEPTKELKSASPAARVGGNSLCLAHIERFGHAGRLSMQQVEATRFQTDVEEVWFAGYHSDVGGGNTPYTQPHALSLIPLRWMVREALVHTNILFEMSVLEEYEIMLPEDMPESGDTLITKPKYRQFEKEDALSESVSPYVGGFMGAFYRITEYLPKIRTDGRGFAPHLMKARELMKPTAERPTRIHSSVLTRLETLGEDPKRQVASRYPEAWGTDNVMIVDLWALNPTSFTENFVSRLSGSSSE
ncbi:hypothetical protein FRC03_003461 [Tulasnella sp. 419]|nr:hypothetical protein FRC03_003461 [Tulasnella sp. 419]